MNRQVSFKNLSHAVMQHSAKTILGTADIVFYLWPDGEISDATFSNGVCASLDPETLRGRSIMDIAHADDQTTLERLIESARKGEKRDPVQIRHSDLIEHGTFGRYSAHLNGDGKNITMIGSTRALASTVTGQAVDAEIDSFRNLERAKREASYKLIFEQSSEGLVIVNLASGLIEQANQNAAEILGTPVEKLVSSPFLWHFDDEGQEGGQEGRQDTGTSNRFGTDEISLTVRSTATNAAINVRTQTVRGLDRTILIIRLHPLDDGATSNTDPDDVLAVQLLKQSEVPVLLTDRDGAMSWSNAALTSFIGNQPVARRHVSEILGVAEDAIQRALVNADRHGRFLTSLTALESKLCPTRDGYLTLVPVPADGSSGYGFLIHAMTPDDDALTESNSRDRDMLAQMIGKAPLKSLVRKSTDVIERNCIEAALRLTGNNRAAAANVLGLSRQSLYIKLNQHDLL